VLPQVVLHRQYWLVCHHDLLQVARIRSVMDFLRTSARAQAKDFVPSVQDIVGLGT
jgi:hypothetical protein